MHDPHDGLQQNAGGEKPEAISAVDSGVSRKQIEELEKQLAQARQELEETKKRHLRTTADFDNFRKRAERDAATRAGRVQKEMLLELVNMLDGLEQAKKQVLEPSTLQGVELILRRFHEVLRKYGCTPVECLGEPFDPELHEGVAFTVSVNCAEGCVAEEVQRGYKFGEELLRPAKVVVAKRFQEKRGTADQDQYGSE